MLAVQPKATASVKIFIVKGSKLSKINICINLVQCTPYLQTWNLLQTLHFTHIYLYVNLIYFYSHLYTHVSHFLLHWIMSVCL